MARSNWIDIQFQGGDTENVRLEKLRRLSQGISDLARTVQILDAGLQLTGEATGSADLSGGTATLAVVITNKAVTNVKLADMPADTIKGRLGVVGTPTDLTSEQVAGLINSDLDHGNLAGLGDDDHTQYVLRSILTDNGDLFTRAAGLVSRIGIGTSLQVLRAVAGAPTWQTISPVLTLGTDLTGNTTFTDLASATLNATIAINAVTDTKLRDSAALSVIGRSANTVGDPADIVAAVDGNILRRSGTTVGFGSILAASISNFDESVEDVIGGILVDSASIDFVYNDAGNTITAVVLAAGVDHGGLGGLGDDDHPQYPLEAGVETISGTWTFSNTITAPALNGASTLQLQVAGTTQQFMTATQNSWALGTSVPATSTTRHVFGTSGNQGIEIAALAGTPRWVSKRYNGTYATPTKTLNGNVLALFRVEGYQETTSAFAAYATLDVTSTVDWTSTDQGHKVTLRSAVNGSTTASASLVLQGAQVQFLDGTVALPAQTWQNDLDTGRYRIGSDQVGDAAGGVLQFELGAIYSDQKTQARWTGVTSPAQIVANTNDYTGAAGAFSVIRFSTDAARNITGLTAGVAGRLALLINIGTQTAVFTHNDAASTAGNRLLNASGANKTVQAGGSYFAWYDGTSAAWRQIASVA